jgi:hypothetical protein
MVVEVKAKHRQNVVEVWGQNQARFAAPLGTKRGTPSCQGRALLRVAVDVCRRSPDDRQQLLVELTKA